MNDENRYQLVNCVESQQEMSNFASFSPQTKPQ